MARGRGKTDRQVKDGGGKGLGGMTVWNECIGEARRCRNSCHSISVPDAARNLSEVKTIVYCRRKQ